MMLADPGGSPPPQLELPSWRGLDRDADVFVDHDAVIDAFRTLRGALGALHGQTRPSMSASETGPGTLNEVETRTNLGMVHFGGKEDWETVYYYQQNAGYVHEVLFGTYDKLVEHIEQLCTAAEKAVENYKNGNRQSSA